MELQITNLKQALTIHPDLQNFTLVGGGDSWDSSMSEFMRRERRRLSRVTTIIALKDEDPVGWAWLIHRALPNSRFMPKRFLTCWIYTEPDYRRQAIGTTLYEKAMEISQQRHRPVIVEPWDSRSHSFYDTFGSKVKRR